MLRDLFTDKKKTIDDIIKFGIYRFAKTIKFELYDVAKQLIYCYYRKQGDLTNGLGRMIEKYIDSEIIYFDEDYNGFSGTGAEFKAELEIDQILSLFETDTMFKEKAIEFYQIRQSYSFLGITGDFDTCLKLGKEIERTIPKNDPYPSINRDLFFEFRDHKKTEFDLMQFAFYISIRSIVGAKSYCITNKLHILSRAFGYNNKDYLPETMTPHIKELFDKYMKRYHIDKVLNVMELNWNIIRYSRNMRGMCIGLKNKISIQNLIIQAEKKKKKNRLTELKYEKENARQKAMEYIHKERIVKKIDVYDVF